VPTVILWSQVAPPTQVQLIASLTRSLFGWGVGWGTGVGTGTVTGGLLAGGGAAPVGPEPAEVPTSTGVPQCQPPLVLHTVTLTSCGDVGVGVL
jgi:hypothetical protein